MAPTQRKIQILVAHNRRAPPNTGPAFLTGFLNTNLRWGGWAYPNRKAVALKYTRGIIIGYAQAFRAYSGQCAMRLKTPIPPASRFPST